MLNDIKQAEINLSIWKYFTDDAAKTKDRIWTMASCIFTLQAGLLAFIGKHLKEESLDSLLVENNVIITCFAEK